MSESKWVEKLWGSEEILVNGDRYCAKLLFIRGGFRSSLHYHLVKDETFIAWDGVTALEVANTDGTYEVRFLRARERDSVHLPPGVAHRFKAVTLTATILEVSTPHSDDDVVRIEPSAHIEDDASTV